MPYYLVTVDAEEIFTDPIANPLTRSWLLEVLQANGSGRQSLYKSGLVPGVVEQLASSPTESPRYPSDYVCLPKGGAVMAAWTDRNSALLLQHDLKAWLHHFHGDFDRNGDPISGTSRLEKRYRSASAREKLMLPTSVNSFVLHDDEPRDHRIDCAFVHFGAQAKSDMPEINNKPFEFEVWAVGARPVFQPPWTSKRSKISNRRVYFYEMFTSVAEAEIPDG